MQIVETKEDEKCCCSCKRNIRESTPDGYVDCHCELDGHYIGYVNNFNNVCEEWEEDDAVIG